MKFLLTLCMLIAVLFAPTAIVPAAFAAPSPTCFAKAANGDVLDPPVCVVAVAHEYSSPSIMPFCGGGADPCQFYDNGKLYVKKGNTNHPAQ